MPSFHPRSTIKLVSSGAAWPRRISAFIIDFITLVMIAAAWLAVGGFTNISLLDVWIGPVIALSIMLFLIATVTRRKQENGQSLGKQAMGLRIIREDNIPVRSGTVLLREIVYKWTPLGICLYGLAEASEQTYWWLYLAVPVLLLVFTISADRRAPHDVLARTRVMPSQVGRE